MKMSQVKYIVTEILGITDWTPEINDKALKNLDICQSKLEIAFLFGAVYRMWSNAQKIQADIGPIWGKDVHDYPAIWIVEPWSGYYTHMCTGPSGLAFIPQYKAGDITADFAIAECGDNGGAQSDWDKPYAVVEIDGYAVHKKRREKDEWREKFFAQHGYKVFHLYEEEDNPILWFDKVIDERNGVVDG